MYTDQREPTADKGRRAREEHTMKIKAYICYGIRGYHVTYSLCPINNGIAPDGIQLTLPEGFALHGSSDGCNTWIEHIASGGICHFAQRGPGDPPMLVWQ